MVVPLFKKIEHRIHRIADRIIQDDITERVMTMADDTQAPTQRPVAYDANGQPLYAAPTEQSSHQVVHVARAAEPVAVQVSDDVRRRHEESKQHYPWLNLSDHEYVINSVPRHSIGMWAPVALTTIISALVLSAMLNYDAIAEPAGFSETSQPWAMFIGVLLIAAFLLGGYLAIWVYLNNRFFLTNESVIQEIQTSIFSKREQTVSLMNIEDASFTQRGPLQIILNYGSIRLSTEGDETTYRFDYVANPRVHIATLNNAVEAFKNGRPVEANDD